MVTSVAPRVDRPLDEPGRLRALHAAGLAAAAEGASLDRLTRTASRYAEAPCALLSLIEPERQVLVSSVGLPGSLHELPITHSLCQFVVRHEEPLIVTDARRDAVLHTNGAVAELGTVAYAGYPVRAPSGDVIGALCVIDTSPREWAAEQLELVADLAETATSEIALRLARTELSRGTPAEPSDVSARVRDRMRDELVAIVSHELRGPISAIRGYTEVLLDDPALADAHRRWIDVIDRKSADLEHLVGDLLDLAALDAGQVAVVPRPISLSRLVRDAVDDARPAADSRRISLTAELGPHLPVLADPARLGQVVGNLLSNAVKYTPDGGRVRVSTFVSGADARLTIADSGIGIPAEEYPLLFERFFRASSAVERGIKGTGLGLAISRAIVTAHGGSISASPRPGGGTVFTVRLPAAEA